MIVPVILSGGAGTRLWPLSREEYPKQLLALHGDQTMLQGTLSRLQGLANVAPPLVVCNEVHRFLVAEQLRSLGSEPGTIILEPCGRNTAPAVAVAALQALTSGGDPVLLVLPADHLIAQVDVFQQTVMAGRALAQAGKLVTFGIVPGTPETGYGYIKAGEALGVRRETGGASPVVTSSLTPHVVQSFVEKPDFATAQEYVASGDYFWNSGMFMFKASCFLAELQKFAPRIFESCRAAQEAVLPDLDFLRLDKSLFSACPSDSVDYAVMEKTADAVVIPLDAGWNDVGAWSALWEVGPQDEMGNVLKGDILTEQVKNCYLHADSRLIAGVGIDNLIVVETADAVLVADKDRVQDVKAIVTQLKKEQRSEALLHKRVNRPWGSYQCVDAGERFQVKRIMVHPGAQLSLQMHHHRAEHWIVVKGTAKVTRGEEILILCEDQSTYIPLGMQHRLENPGRIALELIEVQSGSYLGEDDIIRFDDEYGR